MSGDGDPYLALRNAYEQHIAAIYPHLLSTWPVVSGANAKCAGFRGWAIWAFYHTGARGVVSVTGAGELATGAVGADDITAENYLAVRRRLERHFRLSADDCILMISPEGYLQNSDLVAAQRRHEKAMNIGAMRIFLSHKGADKPMVRDFDRSLRLFGYDTWLDEDAMTAGANLERGISKGFADSCASVFFITQNYKDDGYLATEVEYAIREKRAKGDAFQIVTIAFDGVSRDSIPELIRSYVWKTPSSHLEALQEIVKALPIKVGDVYWRA